MNNELGKRLSSPEVRSCKLCSEHYTAYYEGSSICGKCQNKIEGKQKTEKSRRLKEQNKQNKEKEEISITEADDIDVLDEIELEPTRHCHDCGIPISNFRCHDCWVKWKIKNGISIWSDSGDDI